MVVKKVSVTVEIEPTEEMVSPEQLEEWAIENLNFGLNQISFKKAEVEDNKVTVQVYP